MGRSTPQGCCLCRQAECGHCLGISCLGGTRECEQAAPSLLAVACLHARHTCTCAAAVFVISAVWGHRCITKSHMPALPAAQLNLKASSNRRTASQPQLSQQQQQQQGQGKQQGPGSARIKAEHGSAR